MEIPSLRYRTPEVQHRAPDQRIFNTHHRDHLRQERENRNKVYETVTVLMHRLNDHEIRYRKLGGRYYRRAYYAHGDADVPEYIYRSIVDAFHNDTPFHTRSFFQPWRDAQDTISYALECLGDVSRTHSERFEQALEEVPTGEMFMNCITQALTKLEQQVTILERIHSLNQFIGSTGHISDAHRYRACWSWVMSLPETDKLLRAGKSSWKILWDILDENQEEDGFEDMPRQETLLSSLSYTAPNVWQQHNGHLETGHGDDWEVADVLNSYQAPRHMNGSRRRANSLDERSVYPWASY